MYVYLLMIDPRIAELIILNQGDIYLKMEYLKMLASKEQYTKHIYTQYI